MLFRSLSRIAASTQDLAAVSEEQAASSEEIAAAVQGMTARVSGASRSADELRSRISSMAESAGRVARDSNTLAFLSENLNSLVSKFMKESAPSSR